MFRYFQRSEEGGWSPIPDAANVEELALADNARKLTILAVSEMVSDETDRDHLSYRGPLYFDIDYKGDLAEAIRSAKDLCRTLIDKYNLAPEAIWPFCSGSKGLHVLIPEIVFSSGRAMKLLPLVYKEMARVLCVPGMDFQVYSTGRGNSFRIPNIQRADGNYRVPITVEELFNLDPDLYKEYVSAPRRLVRADPKTLKSPALESLFETAKRVAKERPRLIKVVEIEALKKVADEPPACVKTLMEGKTRPDATFNQVAMQAAAWAARSGAEDTVYRAAMSKIAESTSSSQYDTAKLRYDHLMGLVRYARSTPRFGFSCVAMRSVLSYRPCEGCALEQELGEADEAAVLQSELGIYQDATGWYRKRGEDGKERLSNFSLVPSQQIMEVPQDGRAALRVATKLDVYYQGERVTHTTAEESAFETKSGFLALVRGVKACAFLGTDLDVQRIKAWLFSQMDSSDEVSRVYSAGIHCEVRDGSLMRTYVEPGYSVNQYRVEGTHLLSGHLFSPPKLKDVPNLEPSSAALKKVFHHFSRLNQPEVMGLAIGWFAASHLRQHLHYEFSQFPILSIWGAAQSGKTTLCSLLLQLNGCDFIGDDGFLNAALVKRIFVLDEFVSSTTTIPRVLDEANKSKMKENYTYMCELLKAAWNMQSSGRGTLSSGVDGRNRGGAKIQRYPITAPCVTLSEQPHDMPALVQRSVTIHVTAEGRRNVKGDVHLQHCSRPEARLELRKLAKLMTSNALVMDTNDVADLVRSCMNEVPESLGERPRYSYAVVLTGLLFLARAAVSAKLDIQEDINILADAVLRYIDTSAAEITADKRRSEVDALIGDVVVMIELTKSGLENLIVAGDHWCVEPGEHQPLLYLDIYTVHALYLRYKRRGPDRPPLENPETFIKLLREEPYFVSGNAVPQMTGTGKPMVALDLNKLRDKGIRISPLMG